MPKLYLAEGAPSALASMSKPRYCECGRKIWAITSPKNKTRWRGQGRMKNHDMCWACWKSLKNPLRRPA